RVAGASPALQHFQNPFVVGSTTYSVYRYVTWVDSPTDGTGSSDAADGNDDGVSDASGHDEKRVTVVVTWTDEFGRTPVSQSQSSLFTDGKITYRAPTINNPPAVSCPTAVVSGKTANFTAVASDSDGSIASIAWTFKTTTGTVLGTATAPAKMRCSNDGTTGGSLVAYSTTASWTLTSGDGTKTVYARFYDSAGTLYSAVMTDTIVLDSTAPGAPTTLKIASSSTSGS